MECGVPKANRNTCVMKRKGLTVPRATDRSRKRGLRIEC